MTGNGPVGYAPSAASGNPTVYNNVKPEEKKPDGTTRLSSSTLSNPDQVSDWALFPLIMAALTDRIDVVEGQINSLIGDMENRNRDAQLAAKWREKLASIRPEGKDDKLTQAQMHQAVEEFQKENSVTLDPFSYFGLKDFSKTNSGDQFTQSQVDQMIESTKSYESSVSSDQQMLQLNMQRAMHALNEAVELLSASEKSLSTAIESVIRAVG